MFQRFLFSHSVTAIPFLWEWIALLAHLWAACTWLFQCHNMFTTPLTARQVQPDFTTLRIYRHFPLHILCDCYTSVHVSSSFDHLCFLFSCLSVPSYPVDFCTCLNQLNKASGNEKNKSALSEDFSHFQFPPRCYRQCITYFKSAVLCFFFRKYKQAFLFQKWYLNYLQWVLVTQNSKASVGNDWQ